ncbi:MAG TPA: IS110 family transposase [Terriglobales bacterium]|nr:IS110 family transposase [Terriglobales bacterium]
MEQFIGCDAHKKYSVFVAVNERGEASKPVRVGHERQLYRQFLEQLPVGSQIALEASGHYYWIVDEMESAGHNPRLVHPLEAKKRMGKTRKKTDKVDAKGLGILLRNGTLPEVWIPSPELRDQRELLRLRMFLVQQRTRFKNRIHGALARYNIQLAVRDVFSVEGRRHLGVQLTELPKHTRESVEMELVTLDFVGMQIEEVQKRLGSILQVSVEADLLQSLPYVGPILSMVMALEIGRVERFPSAAHLASYAGLVPRVNSSGGHTRLGQICGDVNRYLKWAFIEAGNLVVIHQKHLAGRHVVRLYQRVKRKRNFQKAVVAVARHLAEAAWWILTKQEVYREPHSKLNSSLEVKITCPLSSTHG